MLTVFQNKGKKSFKRKTHVNKTLLIRALFACVSIALRRLITKNLVEKDDHTLSCNSEFPIFEAEEEEIEEIP